MPPSHHVNQREKTPPLTLDLILAAAQEIADEMAQHAAVRDRERILPHTFFTMIRSARIGALRIPSALGGPGASIRETLSAITRLAAGDSNVAHALRSHFNFVETLLLGPPEITQRYLASLLQGDIYGGAHTELGTSRPGEVRTTLTHQDSGYFLNGRKYYATGALFADHLFISAIDEAGNPVGVAIDRHRPGVLIQDDWDGMGQRLTASGSIILEQVAIAEGEFQRNESTEPTDNAGRHAATFRQLYLAACIAGIIENVLSDAREYVQHIARPITHSHASRSVDDLFVQRQVGAIAARSQAINALVASAADGIDIAFQYALQGSDDTDDALLRSALTTAQLQTVIGELALAAANDIFNTGGGSATSRRLNFDRHWRNIRTLLGHNPLDYKLQIVGDYILTGQRPPLSGGFF